jgi:hypothetical protein
MTGHLADEVLMDVVDGTPADTARVHLAGCAECRRRVDEAREGLALLGDAEVPEPAPEYWTSFRGHVQRRLEASPAGRLLRPALMAPLLAAAAAVVVAVWAPRPFPSPVPSAGLAATVLPAWSALPSAEEDAGLMILGAVMPTAGEVALAPCNGAACLMAELSEEESAALLDALRRELPEREL